MFIKNKMETKPTWSIILAGLFLIYLGYTLQGFFIINYFIGVGGILLGIFNLVKKK
jgi:hypothetical protein